MELIVTSFLLVSLTLFGHLTMVIGDQLRRPKRTVLRFAELPHEPPPAARLPAPCTVASTTAA